MKLASLKSGGRDGRLVVVSRDLTRCLPVSGIAPTLQAALDDWASVAPRLAEAAAALEASPTMPDSMAFAAAACSHVSRGSKLTVKTSNCSPTLNDNGRRLRTSPSRARGHSIGQSK